MRRIIGLVSVFILKTHCKMHNQVHPRPTKLMMNTVNSPASGHPRELKTVSVSRAVRLRELFPYWTPEKNRVDVRLWEG